MLPQMAFIFRLQSTCTFQAEIGPGCQLSMLLTHLFFLHEESLESGDVNSKLPSNFGATSQNSFKIPKISV